MKVLVINCGSSSLKYQLIDMSNEEVLAKGKCDRIGIDKSFIEYKAHGEKIVEERELKNHTDGFTAVLEKLLDEKIGVIKSVDEVSAIGHRIVNGGPELAMPMLITDAVIEKFKTCIQYAPLHNPAHLQGILAAKEVMPETPMAMIFDTSFHQTMPESTYLYAIPKEYYTKYGVRKYGAHGTSHKYITNRTAELLGKKPEEINIISCHLGNGASISAVKNGKCYDTSMGLTPLEGLIMGTRSGDIDPAVVSFVMEQTGMSIDEMMNVLNKKSGLLAISETTSDVRDLRELRDKGDEKAKLALDMFAYRVKKYIGSYMAALGHVDAISFAGGIGEFNPDVVEACVAGLEEYGIKYDINMRGIEGKETLISTPDSRIKMFVVPTNEELMIAKETMDLLK